MKESPLPQTQSICKEETKTRPTETRTRKVSYWLLRKKACATKAEQLNAQNMPEGAEKEDDKDLFTQFCVQLFSKHWFLLDSQSSGTCLSIMLA